MYNLCTLTSFGQSAAREHVDLLLWWYRVFVIECVRLVCACAFCIQLECTFFCVICIQYRLCETENFATIHLDTLRPGPNIALPMDIFNDLQLDCPKYQCSVGIGHELYRMCVLQIQTTSCCACERSMWRSSVSQVCSTSTNDVRQHISVKHVNMARCQITSRGT